MQGRGLELETMVKRWWKIFCLGGAGLAIVTYLLHFAIICYFSVDIPYWDEWDIFPPHPGAGTGAVLEWLFRPHNQHWVVPTRAQFLLFYYLNGWNLATQQYFNFAIFGILVLSAAWGLATAIKDDPEWKSTGRSLAMLAPFLVFLLSPICYENHDWAFQSQFHYSLLFGWWGCFFLFSRKSSFASYATGTVMLVLAVLSQSIGGAAAMAVVGLVLVSRLFGWRAYAESRGNALLSIIPVALTVTAVVLLWRRSATRVIQDANIVGPLEVDFWSFLLNLISFGWGIKDPSWETGLFLLLFSMVPLVLLVFRFPVSTHSWLLLSWFGMILGGLAAISLGRADRGLDWAKTPRYAEVTVFLIPLVATVWSQIVRIGPVRSLMMMGGWLAVALLFANNWNFAIYEVRYSVKMEGVECLTTQIERGADSIYCPNLFPRPLGPRLDHARALELSFVEKWLTDSSTSPEAVAD